MKDRVSSRTPARTPMMDLIVNCGGFSTKTALFFKHTWQLLNLKSRPVQDDDGKCKLWTVGDKMSFWLIDCGSESVLIIGLLGYTKASSKTLLWMKEIQDKNPWHKNISSVSWQQTNNWELLSPQHAGSLHFTIATIFGIVKNLCQFFPGSVFLGFYRI